MQATNSFPVSAERRQHVRFGTTFPAFIRINSDMALRACTVLDVSKGGGRVRLDDDQSVPANFVLFFTPSGNVQRKCRVIWQQGNYLGVEFYAPFDPHSIAC